MNVPKGKIPTFFKVFIPELCAQRMQIPCAFTRYMKGKLTETASFLRNGDGTVWAVDIIREGRDLYFEIGWVRFVEDNNVEMGDFLVFQFSGDYFYDFKHLGKSCCQKENVGSFKFTVKPEELENEEEEKRDNPWTDEEEAEEDEDKEYDEEEEEEEDNEDEDEGGKRKAVVKQEADVVNNFFGGYRGQKEVADIFKSGLIIQPENPYFIERVKKKNHLHIPKILITTHKLNIPEEIIITGEDGKEVVSRIASWGDGRTIATDGWRAFGSWNFVKEDEMCLCEFVTHQKLLIRILQFRAGKWMPRPRNTNKIVASRHYRN